MDRRPKIAIILLISVSLIGCTSFKNKDISDLVDTLFLSIKDRDIEKIEEIMPNTELKNAILEDEESISEYMDNISWKVKKVNQVDGKYVASILVRTTDIKSLDNIVGGVNIPKISKEQLEKGQPIDIELKLSFKKIGDKYIYIYDEYTYKEILDTITGGGYNYVQRERSSQL